MRTVTFEEFMDNEREQTYTDHLLRQAIARLSVEPRYSHMTPQRIYNELAAQDREVRDH